MNAATEYRDIVLPYELKPWQIEVKAAPQRFKGIAAGGRSGKTTLAVDWLVTSAPADDMRLGDAMSWYVGPTYTAAEDIAWGKLKMNIRPLQAHGLVKRIYEGDMSIEFVGGQWIQLKGGDNPDSLRGVKLRRLVLDEFDIEKWELWEEVLAPRTADYQAPVMFIGTPKGYHNLHRIREMSLKYPDEWYFKSIKTSDAGTIPQAEIERARRDMDPRVFRQEFEASFETFGGRVFADFDRTKHAPKTLSFMPNAEYCVGMDFGWSAPTACLLINIDAVENVYIFDEIRAVETPIAKTAKEILARVPIDIAGKARAPQIIYCDPAGDSKNEAVGTSSVVELKVALNGTKIIYMRNYKGVIQDGLDIIRKWMRNNKLFISTKCVNLIQALEMYRYPDPKGDIKSEDPLKDGISDHWCDALRYFFANRFPVSPSVWRAM
jgi:phage terminase large subunit